MTDYPAFNPNWSEAVRIAWMNNYQPSGLPSPDAFAKAKAERDTQEKLKDLWHGKCMEGRSDGEKLARERNAIQEERDYAEAEVERLRAELAEANREWRQAMLIMKDERDAAIARAEKWKTLAMERDSLLHISNDACDTARAAHADAMVKINNFESLCANESFVKIDRQYRTPGLMEFMVTTCSNQTHDNAKAYGTTPMGAIAAHLAKHQNKDASK